MTVRACAWLLRRLCRASPGAGVLGRLYQVDCNTAPYRCDAGYFGKAVNMVRWHRLTCSYAPSLTAPLDRLLARAAPTPMCAGCAPPELTEPMTCRYVGTAGCVMWGARPSRHCTCQGDACKDCSGLLSCEECEPTTGVQYIKGERQNDYQCVVPGGAIALLELSASRPHPTGRASLGDSALTSMPHGRRATPRTTLLRAKHARPQMPPALRNTRMFQTWIVMMEIFARACALALFGVVPELPHLLC